MTGFQAVSQTGKIRKYLSFRNNWNQWLIPQNSFPFRLLQSEAKVVASNSPTVDISISMFISISISISLYIYLCLYLSISLYYSFGQQREICSPFSSFIIFRERLFLVHLGSGTHPSDPNLEFEKNLVPAFVRCLCQLEQIPSCGQQPV